MFFTFSCEQRTRSGIVHVCLLARLSRFFLGGRPPACPGPFSCNSWNHGPIDELHCYTIIETEVMAGTHCCATVISGLSIMTQKCCAILRTEVTLEHTVEQQWPLVIFFS